MNIKQKLKVLSLMRKVIRLENGLDKRSGKFLCAEFRDAIYITNFVDSLYPVKMTDVFPELKTEIIKAGIKEEGDYIFPNQLYFKDDTGKLINTNYLTNKQVIWYNKKKLEIISTVRNQLTKGKY